MARTLLDLVEQTTAHIGMSQDRTVGQTDLALCLRLLAQCLLPESVLRKLPARQIRRRDDRARVMVTDLQTGKTKPLRKSPPMKRDCPMWEYMNARLTNRLEDGDRQESMLNSYGRMGWELVAVTLSTNGAHDLNFFFKRRLEK